jgi:hypothetical protein
MIECDALSSRLTVADVGVVSAPPMRKNTSEIRSGSAAGPARPGTPTETSTGELTGPASTIRPDTVTPVFGRTTRAALPRAGTSVAKPRPSTTVPGRVTTIGADRL